MFLEHEVSIPCTLAPPPSPSLCLSTAESEALILLHLPQVRVIARNIHARLPRQVELADLVSAGVLGLVDAIRRYDASHHTALATYAQFRIRGAILDSLRTQDWGPRSLRRQARRFAEAADGLTAILGRAPSQAECAAHLDLDLSAYQQQLTAVYSLHIAAFDADDREEGGRSVDDVACSRPGPLQAAVGSERRAQIASALACLPPRQRQVVVLYYFEELTMNEVGQRLGVGESRVSQLHAQALAGLQRRLRPFAP